MENQVDGSFWNTVPSFFVRTLHHHENKVFEITRMGTYNNGSEYCNRPADHRGALEICRSSSGLVSCHLGSVLQFLYLFQLCTYSSSLVSVQRYTQPGVLVTCQARIKKIKNQMVCATSSACCAGPLPPLLERQSTSCR